MHVNISEVLVNAGQKSESSSATESDTGKLGGLAGVFSALLASFQKLETNAVVAAEPELLSDSEASPEVDDSGESSEVVETLVTDESLPDDGIEVQALLTVGTSVITKVATPVVDGNGVVVKSLPEDGAILTPKPETVSKNGDAVAQSPERLLGW